MYTDEVLVVDAFSAGLAREMEFRGGEIMEEKY